jgi:predicted transcriptional regulator
MSKRSKFELYGEILQAIREDISTNGSARLTRVQVKVNVPFDRFKSYVDNLSKSSLIKIVQSSGHDEIQITGKGFEYLAEYEHVNDFLTAFGLQDVPR